MATYESQPSLYIPPGLSGGPRGPLKFRRPRLAISESYGWCNIVLCSGKNTVFKCSTYNKEGNSSVLDYLLKWVLTFLMSFFSFLGQDDYYHEKLSTRIKGFAVLTKYYIHTTKNLYHDM